MDFKSYLKIAQKEINRELDKIFKAKLVESEKAGQISQEMIQRLWQLCLKGKKIRGILVKLAYQSCGGRDINQAIQVAAGVEVLHASMLIFDDIMDQDDQRRGQPAMHKQFEQIGGDSWYGVGLGINVGVLALVLAYELIESETVLKPVFKYCQQTVYGQALDLTVLPWEQVNRAMIKKIHHYKTVSYTVLLPLMAGAVLAGETDASRLRALKSYAQALGLAFQIQDDILGVFGEPKIIGKPAGADLREGKKTHLIVDTASKLQCFRRKLRHSDGQANSNFQKFKSLIGKKDLTKKETDWLRKIIKTSGALDKSVKIANQWSVKAKQAVSQITADKELQKVYIGLADFVVKREV
ncbi:polyprenyl synthetase family protein [Patescibacteria group bacterium]|nr:polyprenyl synthetase family protein [Patescibacteria group bacterium]MBU1931492.1 polyprenyl synthetase family protein [Patescibacteria group bacterium]